MKKIFPGILIVLVFFSGSHGYAQQFPAGFAPQQLVENLDPTDFVLAPDGRIFITIKSGKIFIVENEQLIPQVFLNITDVVDNFNERGLGHMVLDPDFEINHYYYVYYTQKSTNRNRISRFTANGNSTVLGSELVLVELDVMAGSIHNGGAMGFGPDGKLYVSTGDGANANTAQSKTTLLGKVLRMNPDGSVPADNPFFNDNTYTGNNKLIYALGFRNPFSLDIQPGTGKIMVCDVGNSQWEEINEIQAGKNYGWPLIEGVRTNQTPPENYKDPLFAYSHNDGCSIVGASFYNPEHPQFPAEYTGKFFYADYCSGYIRYVNPDDGTSHAFGSGIDRPLAIRVDHHGTMYYLQRAGMGGGSTGDNTSTPDGSLWKVTYSGTGAPVIAVQPKNILVSVGEDATFNVSASGDAPLMYHWMEDGMDIPGANGPTFIVENAQLSDDGRVFQCHISNSAGQIESNEATLSVTANARPVATILSPATDFLYRAGNAILFSGSATDPEDGLLSASQLTWKIDFHHDTHAHPALQATAGIASGEYAVPRIGETDDHVWYRIYLTATDSEGFSQTVYRDVFPEKTTIQLQTDPTGLDLILDGQPITTPATITSVVGVTRSLEAPALQGEGELFIFNAWANENPRVFSFDVPAEGASYTGIFSAVPIGDGEGLQGAYYNQSRTFAGQPDLVRTDATLNFDWEGGSPDPVIRNDNFTIRWEGDLLPQFTDTYTLYTVSDDGIRVWINNQLIINQWIPQGPTEWSGTFAFTAGERYPVKIEFFEDGGGAVMRFLWSSSLLPKQIVPQTQLFPPEITGLPGVEQPVVLHPTIADSFITVQTSTTRDGGWVIMNLLGQPVQKGPLSEQTATVIYVSELAAGLYFFKTSTGEAVRFIKK